MNTPPVTTSVLITSPPLWRTQTIRVLQLLGLLATFIGGVDFLQLLALVPADVSAWLVVAGPTFAAGAKPLLMLIGDYLDDGVKNDSFKIGMIAFFLCILSIFTPSCENLHIQSDYGRLDSAKGGMIYSPPTRPIYLPNGLDTRRRVDKAGNPNFGPKETPINSTK